ncbi:tetraspanin-7-like [Pollicipes pollicipes]|uniref:tetraspanin-7-like n=1 Tax=Pollicipes pollicipes TaxID=41117 RepID=UPI00188526FF|nr:tetraspanin-7-like [Pollicipes pollicipes]XP_037089271.1 tetraspanin-7-like [Pollicipes pollicipes]XP_037089290.1 tetraspanin-7-like [Pollicipes pollicipes]
MSEQLATVAAMSCMKMLLMLFNVCFWVSGLVILGIGIWMQISLYKYVEVSPEFSASVPYVFIASGGLIILLGTFACCCTVKSQPVLLYIYSFFLLLVFFVVLAAGISAYAYRRKLSHGFQDGLRDGLQEYGVNTDKMAAIDAIQSTLKCCGINGTSDWNNTPYARSHGTPAYPASCCAKWDDTRCTTVHDSGCYKVVMDFFYTNIGIIAGAAIGLAFFQVIGITLACLLAKNAKRAHYQQV